MNFKELTYLDAIDRHRSLTYAARELYISQPALTKFLRRLETDLGGRLFCWDGNNMTPTPLGEKYLEFARETLLRKETFDKDISRMLTEKQVLRVGFCLNILKCGDYRSIVQSFGKKYPGTEVSVTEDFSPALLDMLGEGRLDLVFVTRHTDDPHLVEEKMQGHELALYLSPRLPMPPAKAVPFSSLPWVDLKELEDVLFVLLASEQKLSSEQEIFRENGISPARQQIVKSLQTKVELTRSGPAACFLILDRDGHPFWKDFSDDDRLFSFGCKRQMSQLYVDYSKKLQDPEAVRFFISLFRRFSL